MKVLHTESSTGWGGQEIRILKEALGLRERGHSFIFAVQKGGQLAHRAREAGFTVYELDFSKWKALGAILKLRRIMKDEGVAIVNTHSSMDAWLGGLAARLRGCKIIRTRHLSTPIRKGLNSKLLYKELADEVVTTSSAIIPMIVSQAGIPPARCRCIATGVNPTSVTEVEARAFREKIGVREGELLVGTVCVVRSWKGIQDLMKAAELLQDYPGLRWVVVGGGYIDQYRDLIDLKGKLIFTGHVDNPSVATAALDIFLLLSTAHEGISQASLEAAYREKPLITTSVGGLCEVCLDKKTGLIVPPRDPGSVAKAVVTLAENADLRKRLGKAACALVEEKFLFQHTLDQMEEVYAALS